MAEETKPMISGPVAPPRPTSVQFSTPATMPLRNRMDAMVIALLRAGTMCDSLVVRAARYIEEIDALADRDAKDRVSFEDFKRIASQLPKTEDGVVCVPQITNVYGYRDRIEGTTVPLNPYRYRGQVEKHGQSWCVVFNDPAMDSKRVYKIGFEIRLFSTDELLTAAIPEAKQATRFNY